MAFRIQQKVGVQAPATQVWDVVSDLDHWNRWNPLYTEAEGKLSIGAPLRLKRVLPSDGQRVIEARIVDWVPDSQLIWSRKVGFMATSLSYIELEVLSEEGCVLAIGEIFNGMGADLLPKPLRRDLRNGFLAMCEAAKARAELSWSNADEAYRKECRNASRMAMNAASVEVTPMKKADPVMTFGRQPPKRK
jgi:hypothetical protein